VFQTKGGDRFGHASWFFPVDRKRFSLRYRAETTAARTDIAQQHERRSFVIPTLADVRALRRLTHGMQSEPTR
jgi:hypothetical protein